jgi:Bifunctional DNA primase/polymerase, N-terminal/Primase C terminal 1 (PriCT-1)
MTISTTTSLKAALSLAEMGLRVFPCQPRDKIPVTARGVHDATAEPERIQNWWGRISDLNVGIATGAVSGFWVLDVDGAEGEGSLRKLEAEHCALPSTIEVITGKGRHLYFRIGEHGAVKNSASQIAPGLDVRGDGGYVLAPPSIHPSGRAYAWSVDSIAEFADAPDWLYALIGNISSNGPKGKPLEHWHGVLTNPVHNGARNATLTSVCGKLLHSGVTDLILLRDLLLCVNTARCNEPLPEADVETIVRSVAQTHLKRLRNDH